MAVFHVKERQEVVSRPQTCIQDKRANVTKCRPTCEEGSFSLHGMVSCQPWLTCEDIANGILVSDQILGQGAVKTVRLGKWKTHNVAISRLNNKNFVEDFDSNLQTLLSFEADSDRDFLQNVVQLVGFCKESHTLVTDYHFFGSADKLDLVLNDYLPHLDKLSTKFPLCLNYVSILEKLHSHKMGPRVLCDSNTPEKSLSQFLLADDLKLVLNDMDALPVLNEDNSFLIKCGHRELYGDFVAPEQMWPYEDEPFDDSRMPGYDEKADIWKVPDVCLSLIGKTLGANKLLIHLFNIHAKCKTDDPQLRPSAGDVLTVYKSVWNDIFVNAKQERIKHVHEML